MTPKRLLFVVNSDWFFVSHRLPLAIAAREAGYEVHLATEYSDKREQLEAIGIKTHRIPLERSGLNPLAEARTVFALGRIMHQIKPDLVHLITPKCVIYGGLLARFAGKVPVLAAISGLGSAFTMSGLKGKMLRALVVRLYRLALSGNQVRIIFQNTHDRSVFTALGIAREDNSELISGSGVDLNAYQETPEQEGTPVVTFASRLLREKGVAEFIKAAQIVSERGHKARWILSGKLDPENRTGVSAEEIAELDCSKQVDFIGYCENIPQLFARSHLVVLPSYYREGLPKVLIEAAACGRAVVTTTNPGCVDAIIPEVTGVTVPCRDPQSLADAIQGLLLDGSRRQKMGREARLLAEKSFSLEGVKSRHMTLYRDLTQS